MKKYIFVIVLSCISIAHGASAPSFPKLFFEYSWLYDNLCSPHHPMPQPLVNEAYDKEPHFTKIWEEAAPVLFEGLFRRFPIGFKRSELTATLSVCAYAPSMSHPMALNVVPYLESYMGQGNAEADSSFVNLVLHELLHHWVDEVIPRSTPLKMKYKNESKTVRSHLHLMAIQKYMYSVVRPEMVKFVDGDYTRRKSDYSRAWQIVNEEGVEAFLSEIKLD